MKYIYLTFIFVCSLTALVRADGDSKYVDGKIQFPVATIDGKPVYTEPTLQDSSGTAVIADIVSDPAEEGLATYASAFIHSNTDFQNLHTKDGLKPVLVSIKSQLEAAIDSGDNSWISAIQAQYDFLKQYYQSLK